MRPRSLKSVLVMAVVVFLAVFAAAPLQAAEKNAYTVHPLVADQPGAAPTVDPDLVNAWGLVAGPTTPWWVADNGTDRSTLYTGAGAKVPLTVEVPGGPTGIVFNGTTSFVVGSGAASGPARFIFVSEDGIIRGWNPTADPTHALVGVDRSGVGAIYKGLAIAQGPSGPLLYAADFHNRRVDVFNGDWDRVSTSHKFRFRDRKLPRSYAPFGIQAIGSRIFVAYAKQDAAAEDELAGQGRGFVDAYSLKGKLLVRVASHGRLNAPWGLALAPEGFGRFGGDLLVGNFGNGRINAYKELENGHFRHKGRLRDEDGNVIAIDGLWALQFGNGAAAGPTDTLFFTAGPEDESHGLFGSITAP